VLRAKSHLLKRHQDSLQKHQKRKKRKTVVVFSRINEKNVEKRSLAFRISTIHPSGQFQHSKYEIDWMGMV